MSAWLLNRSFNIVNWASKMPSKDLIFSISTGSKFVLVKFF